MLKEIVLALALLAALALGGCSSESDGPGTADGDADTDADGDADADTDTETSTDPDDDNDGDGLPNGIEEEIGTNPNIIDTDGDGCSDFMEWFAGTDPLDPSSNPIAEGDFIFREPYAFDPQPAVSVLAVTTGDATADLSTAVTDDTTDDEDASALVDRISPNAEGGIEDPLHPGTFCAGGLATADDDDDSIPDRFVAVPPGTTVCFDVVPASNQTIQPSSAPQIFKVFLDVIADEATPIDSRTIYFYVPN